jgi:2-polyprenyl-3-methyl-5-hydroxy-6-metoxy-1,4-benzoquinol methylase
MMRLPIDTSIPEQERNMVNLAAKPSWSYRIATKLKSHKSYSAFVQERLGQVAPAPADSSMARAEEELNRLMSGYPRNHEYRIVGKRIVPGFRLYERLRLVAKAYPEPLASFLDIGCCRGFYVLDAATRLGCPHAVGIDVHEPFVAIAQKAAQYVGAGAGFHYASLEQMSSDPGKFGGPFQAVMLIGTYHYLFWGSDRCSTAYFSHDEILGRLASICTDRLIFSGRMTTTRLPEGVKERLDKTPIQIPYTPEAFLQSAEKYFRVSHTGYLGVDPLLVMMKK